MPEWKKVESPMKARVLRPSTRLAAEARAIDEPIDSNASELSSGGP